MTASPSRFDIAAIGNAIVDVLADVDHAFLEAEDLPPGSMRLIDADRAVELYGKMSDTRIISGGAAANTLAAMAALGRKTAFYGQLADDELGTAYAEDLRNTGVHYDMPARAGDPPTGRCLILVSPEGERTMNTFLGASLYLTDDAVDEAVIAQSDILWLEGYLWDSDSARAAMQRGIAIARENGRKIALATCADFCVNMHRGDFARMIDDGEIDMIFANEEEAAILMDSDADSAIEALGRKLPLSVITRGEKGAVAIRGDERVDIAAEPIDRVVDTTGAGDTFAAGFLAGLGEGRSLEDCLIMGAVSAAEVISHYGARPEADLRALIDERLGATAS